MSPTKSSIPTEEMRFVQLLGKGLGEVHGLWKKAEKSYLRLSVLIKIQKQK